MEIVGYWRKLGQGLPLSEVEGMPSRQPVGFRLGSVRNLTTPW